MSNNEITTLLKNMYTMMIEMKGDIAVINKRLDKIEDEIVVINKRIDKIEGEIIVINKRLDALEQDVKAIKECPTIKKELKTTSN